MSEELTFSTGVTATIYGSLDGAAAYLGAQYDGWDAVNDDAEPDKALWRLLVRATRLLDRLTWVEAADTFDERDAIDLGTGDGDAAFPFRAACYELANIGLSSPKVFSAVDQGSNIQSATSPGGGVTYFSPTSAALGSALPLPKVIMDLIGDYLVSAGAGTTSANGAGAPSSSSGGCALPFSVWNRTEP